MHINSHNTVFIYTYKLGHYIHKNISYQTNRAIIQHKNKLYETIKGTIIKSTIDILHQMY